MVNAVIRKGGDSWQWFKERAHGTHAKVWLFILSFSESSFFLIPPDALLIAILLAGSSRWFYYTALTTLASVLGAIFGYIVGAFFYDVVGAQIISFYNIGEEFAQVGALFNDNVFWTVFISAFTPIPFKVFVLSGGFFKVNFIIFILASTLGRGLRYAIIAYLVHLFGEKMLRLFTKYATLATVVTTIVILLIIIFYYSRGLL